MTQTTDAALVKRLRARSDDDAEYGWRSRAEEYAQAADTIEAQARRIEALEGALTNVRYEAERKNGGLVHLKRAISVATRTALKPTP